MTKEKSVEEILFLTDGKENIICHPYSIENMKRMASELGIKSSWFKKDTFVVPKEFLETNEDKLDKVSSQTLFRTLKNMS